MDAPRVMLRLLWEWRLGSGLAWIRILRHPTSLDLTAPILPVQAYGWPLPATRAVQVSGRVADIVGRVVRSTKGAAVSRLPLCPSIDRAPNRAAPETPAPSRAPIAPRE